MLTSKITKIVENHCEFSGCMNSCNKFVAINHAINVMKRHMGVRRIFSRGGGTKGFF